MLKGSLKYAYPSGWVCAAAAFVPFWKYAVTVAGYSPVDQGGLDWSQEAPIEKAGATQTARPEPPPDEEPLRGLLEL